jgi:tetratricopeptide (TPR) repeat protein
VEDLTAALSASHWMKVVAASVTAFYRTGARDLRQIGRHLGVRYLLEGNVRRVAEELRVTAQLVDAENGNILWTQKFGRPVAELSSLQEDLVAELAAHLRVQVELIESQHALKKPADSAWEALMRSHAYSSRATLSGWEAAVAEGKRVVQIDPNDGAAYAGLAGAQGRLLANRGGDDRELAQEIIDNVRRARALDPENPNVLCGIASALATLGKLQDARLLAERAVTLNPNWGRARLALGSVLIRLSLSDEALAELDAAERLDPNSSWFYYSLIWRAVAHLQAGRLDEAREAADRSVRILPAPEALIQSMLCFAKSNRWDSAYDDLRRLRETDPEVSWATLESLVRYFYCGSNAIDEHVATMRKIWDEAASEPRSA